MIIKINIKIYKYKIYIFILIRVKMYILKSKKNDLSQTCNDIQVSQIII